MSLTSPSRLAEHKRLLTYPLPSNAAGSLACSAHLCLFPLTAPFTIVRRSVVGGVPLWQPLLAAGLMVSTIFLIVRAVARMFHAQNLLSGQPFSTQRYFWALLGRS